MLACRCLSYCLGAAAGIGFVSPAANEIGMRSSSSSRVQRPFLWMLLVTWRGEYSVIGHPLLPITCPVMAPPGSLQRYRAFGALFSGSRASGGPCIGAPCDAMPVWAGAGVRACCLIC